MELVSIYDRPDRAELLYALLAERDDTVNISHKSMPTWDDHIKFIESRPYEAWYFVLDDDDDDEVAGSIYLSKQNEIGVFLFKDRQGFGLGRAAVEALMEKHGTRRYLANMNPANERSRELFTSLGFKLIQHTYELEEVSHENRA